MAPRKKERNSQINIIARQRNILQQLEDFEENFKNYDKRSAEEMENLVKDEAFAQMFNEYQELIIKAIRARLDEHPLAEDKIKKYLKRRAHLYRKMGQRDLLRRVKRCLETGVKRPLTEKQVKLLNAVAELRWGDKPTRLSIPLSQEELASPMTFKEIFQKVGKGEFYGMENPFEHKTISQYGPSTPMTFDEVCQKVGKGEVYNPQNPPIEKRPKSWEEVLQILVRRGLIKMSRQTFLRLLERLDPTII
jgi:hypothetical protein